MVKINILPAVLVTFSLISSQAFAQEIQNALPQGANVVSGTAQIQTSGANMNVTTSDRSIINWNSYNIGSTNTVNYVQPSASSVSLNRIVGGDPSSIYGSLTSNGRVFLVNPNGILFGPNSRVDTAGLVASTLNINDDDFINGKNNFYQNGKPSWVINQGRLTIKNGGYVALLSNAVKNSATIEAPVGKVVLASGERMTVGLDDANTISVAIDQGSSQPVNDPDGQRMPDAVSNNGYIAVDGGKAVLNAKVLNNAFDHAVNTTGVIQANGLEAHDGIIELVANGAPLTTGTNPVTATEVNITSDQSIGTPDPVTVKAKRVTAVTTGPGAINLRSTQNEAALNVQTADGPIDITSYGPITLKNAVSLTDRPTNGISLHLNDSGLFAGYAILGNINAGTQGDVSITSGYNGAVYDDGDDSTRIHANQVTFGLGTSVMAQTAAHTIHANAAQGGITINNESANDVSFDGLRSTNNSVILTQKGGGAALINDVQTANGNVFASVDGANLNVDSVNAGFGNIRLVTTGGGNINLGNLSANALDINADGKISQLNDTSTQLTAHSYILNGRSGVYSVLNPINYSADNPALLNGSVLDQGSYSIDSKGTLTAGNVKTSNGSINIKTRSGDLNLNQINAMGPDGALNFTADNGSINAVGPVPYVSSSNGIVLSAPNGTVGVNNPINLKAKNSVLVTAGGQVDSTSGRLAGTIESGAVPTVQNNAPGKIYYNGVEIWPNQTQNAPQAVGGPGPISGGSVLSQNADYIRTRLLIMSLILKRNYSGLIAQKRGTGTVSIFTR